MAKFQVIREKAIQFYQKTLVWCLRHNIGGKALAALSTLLIIVASVIAGIWAIYAFIAILYVMASSSVACTIILSMVAGGTAYFVSDALLDAFAVSIVEMWTGKTAFVELREKVTHGRTVKA